MNRPAADAPGAPRRRWLVFVRCLFACAAILPACSPLPLPGAPAGPSASNHWAFRPVQDPAPPAVHSRWPQTSIDRFILARLQAEGRAPAPAADRRTLLRRATFDLTGLPPSPEEIDAFLADRSLDAFARVVDRLLASPRYGERWGRHWLDVVRYADTAGENTDHPVPDAWRYRNWVIDAFNRDLPYDEFLRQQLAGDLLATPDATDDNARRVIATGYLAIARRFGHEIEKDMHLTFEDTLDTLGKSVFGLSLGCARCHNHKYDPVSMQDYYGLYGILQSTRFPFPGCEPQPKPRDLVPLATPTTLEQRRRFESELAALDTRLRQLKEAQDGRVRSLHAAQTNHARQLAEGQFKDGGAQSFPAGDGAPIEATVAPGDVLQLSILPKANHGADTTLVELEIAEQGGQGRVWNLTADALAGFATNNPVPDRLGQADTWWFLDARQGPRLLPENIRDHDGKKGLHVWRNGDTPSAVLNSTDQPIKVWTTLPPRTLFIHPAPDGPVAVAWLSPVQGTVRLRGRVADGHPGGGDGVAWRLEHFPTNLAAGLRELAAAARQQREPMEQRRELKAREPKVPVAYAVAEGKPGNARLHKRGEPADPGDEVPRKFLDVLGGQALPAGFTNSGRLELARWLTNPGNPLTARVMVNRLWQHHFGRGLVPTPNDFGTRGEPPTHPELLDHLATAFVRSQWSVKAMHRLILLSATYQQAPAPNRPANPGDYAGFRLRRLTAEEIRDTLLTVSGELDFTPGEGHPFPPETTWTFTQHSPFAADYDTLKRSVYVMTKRNKRQPFFTLFDGADPNASTPVRDQTTVPTQALYFMNDPFVHARAERFARRLLAASDQDDRRLDQACRLLYGRPATRLDQQDFADFRREALETSTPVSTAAPETESVRLWSAYARVLFAANEFIHVR